MHPEIACAERSRGWCVVAIGAIALGATSCKPASVGEAETKGDVAWLETEGSPGAIEAIGRLADEEPEARAVLQRRASFDVAAYIAAWGAVKRGGSGSGATRWGATSSTPDSKIPARAEIAASAVDGKDPRIEPFLPDLEAALGRLAASGATSTIAAVLAAAGAPAHDAVVRRLADKATRGPMCGGIAVASSSADARATLRSVPATSRDDATCVAAVATVAQTDDATLKWLGEEAEPGLLGAASRLATLDCPRLQIAWATALATRRADQSGGLAVPLASATTRCPAALDGVLADAIRTKPDAIGAVVGAIDPFSPDGNTLKATCAALPLVARARASAVVKERAADALAHRCQGIP